MPQLYEDLDQVHADFDKLATKVVGMKPDAFKKKYGEKEFWRLINEYPNFFLEVEPLPDSKKLWLNTIDLNPIVLSACPRGNWAEKQKEQWAYENLPGLQKIILVVGGENKAKYCNPGDVLIDDRPKHKHLWEAKGGIFIVHKDADSSLQQLKPYRKSLQN
jgi:hypothetical protein